MRKFSPLLLIFAVVFILYYPSLFVFFSQDDFFHFQVSKTDGSFLGFVKLFGFYPFEERGIAFYRPIFREVLYNIFYSLFGLNHLPFRILSFVIHFINIALVYTLMQKLFRKRALSFFTALFFGISAANVATLYYLAGGIQALGATMFILLTLIFFWEYLGGKTKFKILSFLSFLLALGSHELAVSTPALLVGLIFVREKSKKRVLRRLIYELWFYFAVLLGYLYLEFTRIGFSQSEEQYKAVFSPKRTLNSFAWYWAWALGLPEMLIDFVRPGLKLNPSLVRYWGDFFIIILPSFFASVGALISAIAFLVVKNKKVFKDKRFWLFLFWFPIIILPVVFLPLHKSTYYLAPALPGFWGVVGFLSFSAYRQTKKKYPRLTGALFGGFVVLLITLSATSAKLGDSTYWAASRGRLAEKLLGDVQAEYPTLPAGAAVYFKNDPGHPFVATEWGGTSKQAAFVLNNQDALQLYYNDPTLKVFYEDLGGVPVDFPKENVYSIIAKIN